VTLKINRVPDSLTCEHSRINILQWILTKLGTYLVLKRIWNPIDFQGHRVNFLGGSRLLSTKYVPSLVKIHWRMLILECSQGSYAVKIWPGDIDLWSWKSIGFQTLMRHSRINILQWILTKLGTYLVLKRIWNPIDFQGHRVNFLGEGIHHALRCPCLIK
jgi:hypothetical protein